MKIMITGVASEAGRTVARQLIAAGHRVGGIAERPHRDLDPRVEVGYGGLHQRSLMQQIEAADVVVHLAPVEPDLPESAGIDGVVRVAHAAGRAGARLIFLSQAAGEHQLYREAEELVSSSWVPSLVIRAAPLVGRQVDWMVCRTVATLFAGRRAGLIGPFRVLHADDLHRFLVRAVGSHRTGVIDLATSESIIPVSARRLLTGVDLAHGVPVWSDPDPGFQLVPLQRQWNFVCAWNPADALADTARGLAGRKLRADGPHDLAGRVPLPMDPLSPSDGDGLGAVAGGGFDGEFDSRIDQEYPIFCSSGADGLAGPLTPMALDITMSALRHAQRATAGLLGLPKAAAAEWEHRFTAVFGHRLFTGESITAVARTARRGIPGAADRVRAFAHDRHYVTECADFAAAADAERLGGSAYAAMPDPALDTRIRLLRSRIEQGWTLAEVGALVARPHVTPQPAWETTMRFLDQLCIALREKGSRLVGGQITDVDDDILYLTCDEALTPPKDARSRVQRRRAERERLQRISMPTQFDGRWAPQPGPESPPSRPAPVRVAVATVSGALPAAVSSR